MEKFLTKSSLEKRKLQILSLNFKYTNIIVNFKDK